MPAVTGVPKAELELVIQQVFLTPGNPQSGDETEATRASEEALLNYVCEALHRFGSIDAFSDSAVQRAREAIRFLRDSKTESGDLDAQKLQQAFKQLSAKDGIAPIHVQAQNAAIIASRENNSIIFEFCELAPENDAAMRTQGRLKRHFPGSAVSIPLPVFVDSDLHFSLADTIATMGIQEVKMVKPTVKKSGDKHIEERDSTDPAMVTDFLATILSALGDRTEIQVLDKNTREQVSWKNARMPWRRSPLWLLARVTIQTIFCRAGKPHVYKQFMVFLMSLLLEVAVPFKLPSETLYCMVAKLSGRLKKLGSNAHECLHHGVGATMASAVSCMESSWKTAAQTLEAALPMRDTAPNLCKEMYRSYPNLDHFIQSIGSREPIATSLDFKPSWSLPIYDETSLPNVTFSHEDEGTAFGLLEFESWVATSLDRWLALNIDLEEAPGRLLELIQDYHYRAALIYSDSPEATSLMLLTIMELWIACDKSACKLHELLHDYHHEIPSTVLQSLILPFKGDMERLQRIEAYLETRRCEAGRKQNQSIFTSFGHTKSFGVQFFQSSAEHQALKGRIETWARSVRKSKQREFKAALEVYKSHVATAAELQHDFYKHVNWKTGYSREVHDRNCRRCHHERAAQNMKIEVHEWPLPTSLQEAQNVVFELAVPRAIDGWRDATAYIIFSVLKSTSIKSKHIKKEDMLSSYLSQCYTSQKSKRFVLASTTKSNRRTHRQLKALGTASEKDVLVQNGLKFSYYDMVLYDWSNSSQQTDKIASNCTYQLSKPCSSLDQFLFRPPRSPNGKSANHVISKQSECPEHLSLEEFRAMAALPCGYRVQWLNILTQLHMPMINFASQDVLQILLQVSRQVGPPNGTVYRAGHEFPGRENFTLACLEGLEAALDKMKENWESYQAVSGFIALASRLLSLSTDDNALRECFQFLGQCRAVAHGWMAHLQEKVKQSETDDVRAGFLENTLHVAQICIASFDVDEDHLKTILQSADNAALLLEASIAAHDASCGVEGQQLISKLRCERVRFKAFKLLKSEIIEGGSPCLDMALQQAWSAYPGGATWVTASHPHGHWVTTALRATEANLSLNVQFNLMTGELLVNGNPLSRLPAQYEKHPVYAVLFGKLALEVLPTDLPGMSFSSKKSFHGYILFFGMSQLVAGDFFVVARSGTRIYDLVPSRVFARILPHNFVNGYVHWYDRESQTVEFRDKANPWKTLPDQNWTLRRHEQRWILERQNQYILLGIETSTAQHIAKLLRPIEEKSYLHVVLDKEANALKVELPRLQLDFLAEAMSSRLYSRQYRGMYVDANQGIGALVGLASKLVLRNESNRRKVLIPDGEPKWSRAPSEDHVCVSIPHGTSQKVHPYEVDKLLQRLVDNGSLQSKLVICYLHALTSHCLPDELTGKTGTEQALSILRSASLRSFEYLKKEDIEKLTQIARLSPSRQYYPRNLQCMETVEWDDRLPFLSQDNDFYFQVEDIFSQASDTKVFYPDEFHKLPTLNHVNAALRNRYSIRTASFHVDGFGGENHTTNHDVVYQSRDTRNHTAASNTAFQIAEMMVRDPASLVHSVSPKLVEELWVVLSSVAQGSAGDLSEENIRYDSQWMQDRANTLPQYWCQLHRLLVTRSTSLNRFQVMMCLCAMGLSPTAHLQAIQCLAIFFRKPADFDVAIPSASRYQLSEGRSAKRSEIETAARAYLTPFDGSPEYNWAININESDRDHLDRRRIAFETSQNNAVDTFVAGVHSQWVCATPVNLYSHTVYLNESDAMRNVLKIWQLWYQNHCFHNYLLGVVAKLRSLPVTAARSLVLATGGRSGLRHQTQKSLISNQSMFTIYAPSMPCLEPTGLDLCQSGRASTSTSPRLALLLEKLRLTASSEHSSQRKYVDELEKSIDALMRLVSPQTLTFQGQELRDMLEAHRCSCRVNVDQIYAALQAVITRNLQTGLFRRPLEITDDEWKAAATFMAPRRSASILLGNLARARWDSLSSEWKDALVAFGVALTKLQRAERLSHAKSLSDIVKELANPGHANWEPTDCPESLLLEIESGILIREVQEDIASEMRCPKGEKNAVMQLNMGEGKSSVIVPIVAAYLADGAKLVRVVVGKPQAKELLRTLTHKLGGLLNRRIFHMPFNRSLRLDESEVKSLHRLYKQCMEQGGVLLVQPEHMLSFKLMAVEYQTLPNKNDAATALVDLYHFFQSNSRDIVDESDENFSPKFELIYTMGEQRLIELSPERWTILQRLLDALIDIAPLVQQDMPEGMEITHSSRGHFPRTRILRAEAGTKLLREITQKICGTGLPGLPIGRQGDKLRKAIFDYVFEENVSPDQVSLVETNDGFFTDSVKRPLLLLRGLIAGRVLLFALRQKRWRVNYGLDASRTPSTRLAVPYRAKDSPSTRAEFSHPDVVILLTCLSYYYQGLTDEAMFMAFDHLMRSDQSEIEYHEWVADAPELPSSFHRLDGVNLKDMDQVTKEVFPHLRQAKSAVDYFLSHMVFPKEMKEFSHKLSSSGWDLGEQKRHATTGFSGTNDSRHVLPLDMKQLDIQEQLHTNALVLENLLRPENRVQLMQSSDNSDRSDTDRLLEFVADTENEVHVILDVGAQVLELTNFQVAEKWLELTPIGQKQEAVVFFDDDDEICVIDRKGVVERLQTSPYSEQLDRCLVFLDQAHTRGTDLRLPEHYRAAVTLGPDITKDRLVQACMRMRKLGHGQSVIFCVSREMKSRIHMATSKPADSDVGVDDVLMWAISETHADLRRLMPLWAIQGARFYNQKTTWDSATTKDGITLTQELAETFLEEEAQTIEYRYRPKPQTADTDEILSSFARLGPGESLPHSLVAVQERCNEFGVSQLHSAALQEEQEKELAPEIEQERQIERPPAVLPATHVLHRDLIAFVTTGDIPSNLFAIRPAFLTLQNTSVADWVDLRGFPDDLLVTADYARTVELHKCKGSRADYFQRPIQYILTGHDATKAVIISPYEAQELIPELAKPTSRAHLHLYAPRTTLGLEPLDMLCLYTVPDITGEGWELPRHLRLQVNLFAGQLYFGSYQDYAETCAMLSLAWQPPTAADGPVTVETDGFVAGGNTKFKKSPMQGVKVLLTTLRRDGRDISKTHWGRILGGEFLTEADFEE